MLGSSTIEFQCLGNWTQNLVLYRPKLTVAPRKEHMRIIFNLGFKYSQFGDYKRCLGKEKLRNF